jgi:hypothetical protein
VTERSVTQPADPLRCYNPSVQPGGRCCTAAIRSEGRPHPIGGSAGGFLSVPERARTQEPTDPRRANRTVPGACITVGQIGSARRCWHFGRRAKSKTARRRNAAPVRSSSVPPIPRETCAMKSPWPARAQEKSARARGHGMAHRVPRKESNPGNSSSAAILSEQPRFVQRARQEKSGEEPPRPRPAAATTRPRRRLTSLPRVRQKREEHVRSGKAAKSKAPGSP